MMNYHRKDNHMQRRRSTLLLSLALVLLLPLGAAADPNIVITKTAQPDNDPAQPGDTIKYVITIVNTGDMDATNVNLQDTIDANTTFTAGSLNVTPIARNDSFDALGNVSVAVPVGSTVLGNDTDPGGGSLTGVTAVQGVSGNVGNAANTNQSGLGGVSGSVIMQADGSFTYEPPPGFVGTDTFEYTVTDGSFNLDTATVSITTSDMMIWFIDNSSAVTGDGTINFPFTSITDFNSAQGASRPSAIPGDSIFVAAGNADYTDGIVMQTNQILIGEAAGDAIESITGLTPPTFSDPLPTTGGTAPVLTDAIANAIEVATDNTIRGLDIGTTSGTGIAGTGVGNLTISEVAVNTGSGVGVNINTGNLDVT
jgi:uncharacterized repeat protein (TIGR01451 family)